MKASGHKQRGVILILVLMIITIVGGFLTFLAVNRSNYYRMRQAERVRIMTRQITDSAADYVRMHKQLWAENPPEKPLELDVSKLLPSNMTGSATIHCLKVDGRQICRVSASVIKGAYQVIDELKIEID